VTARRDLALEVLELLADGETRTSTAIASGPKGGIRARRVEVEKVLARLEAVGALVSLYDPGVGPKAARRFALPPTYCPAPGTNGSSDLRVFAPTEFVRSLYRERG